MLGALIRMGVAAVLAGLAALGVAWLLGPLLDGAGPVGRAWVELGVATVVGLPVTVAAMLLLRVPELTALRRRLRGRAAGAERPA